MLAAVKGLFNGNRRKFLSLCSRHGLIMDYVENIDSLRILEEIFDQRIYADFFPFNRKNVILDIGAHKGYFTLWAAKIHWPALPLLRLNQWL